MAMLIQQVKIILNPTNTLVKCLTNCLSLKV